jgi:hypothetical protein
MSFLSGRTPLTTVQTADIADNAVTGGKLNPSLVAGDVIYADGTDSIARLAKGAASQQLAMNSGATAPEWVAAATPDYGVLLQTVDGTTASSSINLTAFDSGTYTSYIFLLEQVIPSTDGTTLWMRFSTDGGSSFVTTSQYFSASNGWNDSNAQSQGGSGGAQSAWYLTETSNWGNASDEGLSGEVRFFQRLTTSVKRPRFTCNLNYSDDQAGVNEVASVGGGAYKGTTEVDAIQFLSSSGNIGGIVKMYGIK